MSQQKGIHHTCLCSNHIPARSSTRARLRLAQISLIYQPYPSIRCQAQNMRLDQTVCLLGRRLRNSDALILTLRASKNRRYEPRNERSKRGVSLLLSFDDVFVNRTAVMTLRRAKATSNPKHRVHSQEMIMVTLVWCGVKRCCST